MLRSFLYAISDPHMSHFNPPSASGGFFSFLYVFSHTSELNLLLKKSACESQHTKVESKELGLSLIAFSFRSF